MCERVDGSHCGSYEKQLVLSARKGRVVEGECVNVWMGEEEKGDSERRRFVVEKRYKQPTIGT